MPTRAESLFGQEAQLARLGQGLELRVGSQGLQQRADVVPDRRLREVEISTDLLGRLALGQQFQNLDLPRRERGEDRKSTRLNSSHANISYAVFCLKKK